MPKSSTQRILVIERQVAVGRVICKLLSGSDYVVDETRDCVDLMRTINDSRYDLILASLSTLGPSPLNIIAQIKKSEIPLLLMTGGAEQDVIEKAISMGAHGPIAKPFDSNVLMAMIRDILR